MRLFANKPVKEKKVVSAAEHQEDYYKGVRSAVVIIWMFCNFALAAVVLSAGGLETVKIGKDSPSGPQRSTIYMAVVLWSVAALSLFRFCGAVWFLIVRMVSVSLSRDWPSVHGINLLTYCSLVPRRLIICIGPILRVLDDEEFSGSRISVLISHSCPYRHTQYTYRAWRLENKIPQMYQTRESSRICSIQLILYGIFMDFRIGSLECCYHLASRRLI